jgi:hypothetical protein
MKQDYDKSFSGIVQGWYRRGVILSMACVIFCAGITKAKESIRYNTGIRPVVRVVPLTGFKQGAGTHRVSGFILNAWLKAMGGRLPTPNSQLSTPNSEHLGRGAPFPIPSSWL